MKKIIPALCVGLLFSACNMNTPENYFDLAVLNSNTFAGFADEGMVRQLESPSVKQGSNGGAVPMFRDEVLTQRIQYLEDNYKRLRELKQTDDTRDIVQNSMALYEYVLPVYKNEYMELGKLYDQVAPKEQVNAEVQLIHDKYFAHFKELYDKLISSGKIFAARHNIQVKWDGY